MTYAVPYFVTTCALALVMTAAVWRPTVTQAVLLLTGPVVTGAAFVGPAWGVLGLLGVLIVPFAYLLVSAVLPWSKLWARWAVPATVLAVSAVLAAPSRFLGPLFVLPLILAFVALLRALFQLHWTGVPSPSEPETTRGHPAAGRAVVIAATLQGVAALLAGAYCAAIGLNPRANIGTNGIGMLEKDLGLLLAGVAVAVAAVFLGVAVGLSRRYRDFRYVFTAVQVIALALCMWTGHGAWVWGAVAWVAATVTLAYLGAREDSPKATAAR